jgi:glycyl-tRNA synthetase alpha subunit
MLRQSTLSFQDVIMRLERYWADHGCLIWQPYSEKVGAGTANPATVLRVLGPEPNVAYVEPSYRLTTAGTPRIPTECRCTPVPDPETCASETQEPHW